MEIYFDAYRGVCCFTLDVELLRLDCGEYFSLIALGLFSVLSKNLVFDS